MFRVKICGITSWTDARLAIDLGADALGFNFYRPSPRYVSVYAARRIIARLPKRVKAVGVFVNGGLDEVVEIAEKLGLSYVQLHGRESPKRVAEVASSFPVIKAFRVGKGFRPKGLAQFRKVSAFLLDGFRPGMLGGTGKSWDWEIARRAKRFGRIILAGGLTPDNVAEAVRKARPTAIDVCSGVEGVPGKKDAAKMREFMRQVQSIRGALE